MQREALPAPVNTASLWDNNIWELREQPAGPCPLPRAPLPPDVLQEGLATLPQLRSRGFSPQKAGGVEDAKAWGWPQREALRFLVRCQERTLCLQVLCRKTLLLLFGEMSPNLGAGVRGGDPPVFSSSCFPHLPFSPPPSWWASPCPAPRAPALLLTASLNRHNRRVRILPLTHQKAPGYPPLQLTTRIYHRRSPQHIPHHWWEPSLERRASTGTTRLPEPRSPHRAGPVRRCLLWLLGVLLRSHAVPRVPESPGHPRARAAQPVQLLLPNLVVIWGEKSDPGAAQERACLPDDANTHRDV